MPSAPLDVVEYVLNLSRVRLNDAIENLSGDVLTDNWPSTLPYLNGAWRRCQERLVDLGVTWFKPEIIFSSVPLVTSTDTGSQQNINWVNFNDGTNPQSAPVLPQNLITPMLLWERATSTAPTGAFYEMSRVDNGLPAIPKQSLNFNWEWRDGAIYIPGATVLTDIRVRYAGIYPDFVLNTTTSFSTQTIPIPRIANPLAWMVCSEVAKARGDTDTQSFDTQAENYLRLIFNLDPLQARSIDKESEYQKMTNQYSPTQGPNGPRGLQSGTGGQ